VSTTARRLVRDRELSVAPELALTALTIGAVVGFGRLFDNGRYFGPVFLAAIGSHLVAWLGRRVGLGLPAAALLSLVAGAVVLVWVIEPSTTTYGIPRGASWHAMGNDLRDAWQRFGDVVAPTPSTEGFVAAAAIGAWAAAFLADAAAFRLQATFEAVVPSLTLFVFSSALGPDSHRVLYTIAYLAGLLVFVLVSTATRRAETTSWFAGRRGGGAGTIAQGGIKLAAVGVVVAALVGPALPGAHSESLVQWRHKAGSSGPRNRVTVSPLVDIQSRLIDQGSTEFFTVKTAGSVPRYWRLTALEDFDGTIWKSSNSYKDAGGRLPQGEPSKAAEKTLRQVYSIRDLSSIWLPAAVRPERLTGQPGARYDEESGSLISSTANGNGLTYTVVSRIPQFLEADLARVPRTIPKRIRDRYLKLPGGFPARVTAEARRVTASAPTQYRKALALQTYFRSSRFKYDVNVNLGTDEKAIVQFLFETQTGFCQQFAGTYAAMARAIGLPARVAVGFVPGLKKDDGFHVRGRDAHAWPEVYLAGYGWVPFEPTPADGRGLPGGDTYAGTPAYQARTTDDPAPTATSAPPTTAAPAVNDPSNRNLEDLNVGAGSSTSPGGHRPWWRNPVVILIVLGGLAATGLTTVPVARTLRRRRRRAAAVTPRARVLVAWEEAEEILAVAAGLPRRPAETPLEYATRVAGAAEVDAGLMTGLAHDTAAAGYSVADVDEGVADRTEAAVADVRRTLLARASRAQRVRWSVDPRNLR
jgi:transglutaminase-like putative cysteine protease